MATRVLFLRLLWRQNNEQLNDLTDWLADQAIRLAAKGWKMKQTLTVTADEPGGKQGLACTISVVMDTIEGVDLVGPHEQERARWSNQSRSSTSSRRSRRRPRPSSTT